MGPPTTSTYTDLSLHVDTLDVFIYSFSVTLVTLVQARVVPKYRDVV